MRCNLFLDPLSESCWIIAVMLVSQESRLVNAWINRPRNSSHVKVTPTRSQPKRKQLARGDVVPVPAPTPTRSTLSLGNKHPSPDPELQPSVFALDPPNQYTPNVYYWYLCLTALGIFVACALGSGWSTKNYSLIANHISIDQAITNLHSASTIIAERCCPIPVESAKTARSSLDDAVISGRTARSAVDAAVEAINQISSQVAAERIEKQHGLSCLQARLLAVRLRGVARQSLSAAIRHRQTLNHTEKAAEDLDGAIKETNLARERLYADRKSKHKSTWGQAQELLGISSSASGKKTLDEYNTQNATASILAQAREQTVLASSVWRAQQALWNMVAADLQRVGDILCTTTDVPGRSEPCVTSDQYQALMREAETSMRQVVVESP
jgi:hypothetical protein